MRAFQHGPFQPGLCNSFEMVECGDLLDVPNHRNM